ncbi:related to outer membrane protein [Desulfotalea psychrophila LSv54]|uniref:Outer membrane protein assembly factor BamA n=2 Tax=Desulfotalea psychrophila TaxID=84980 RepID=Q6ARL5_DESPS|nr:related to outer membrane protein [Desulfotalea psychrophila LSv54]
MTTAFEELVGEVLSYTDREHRIAAISPQGNARVDSGAILRKINSKAGDIYDPATLRQDLKAIYAMGYFNDVQVDVKETAKGKTVTFNVVEKPLVSSVLFVGLKELKQEDVQAVANIKEHRIINPAQISAAKEAIISLYESKGFYNCTVKSEISYPAESGGAVVTFNIVEGHKVYVEEISFEGNKNFDAGELEDILETKEKSWLTWLTAAGLLDMEKIKQDGNRLLAYYNNHGFLDAKVGEPQVRQEGDLVYLHFVIAEGPRYRIGLIDFSGDLMIDKKTLAKLVSVRNEPYLNRGLMRDDIMNITDAYSELGYAFASVKPRTRKSAVGNRIDITFDIAKNDLVYIDRITINGNVRTRDNVIRRELRIVEGGLFDSAALRKSNKALQRLGYFKEVNITPEPTSDPSRMNIVVNIKEKPTGSFSIGVGYSTTDGIIVSGKISENNFLGRGDTLSLSGDIGGISSNFNLGYTNPHLNDSELSWGADLFNTEREFDDYDKKRTGAGLRVGYPIWQEWRLFSNYSITDTKLTDIKDNASWIIKNSADINLSSAVKFTLVSDDRDKQFMPTEGSRTSISLKYAGGPLMGDAQFYKVEASTSWYFPAFLGTTYHLKGAAGYAGETETDKLPVYERFYLGGMNSMRGFEYAKMSPVDKLSGDRVGGNMMWYTNVEWIFPISDAQGVNGMTFFDIGQVSGEDLNGSTLNGSSAIETEYNDVKMDVGLGLMWNSPMGPLTITWGYNLDPLDDEDPSVFNFSMGGNF